VELFEELTDGVVTLRPWSMDDLPALVAACNDETLHYWLPMFPFPYRDEDGRFISHQPERNAEGSGNVGIFDTQKGKRGTSAVAAPRRPAAVPTIGADRRVW
jgi:RimJ/RimL family protein N-acetyltransferase